MSRMTIECACERGGNCTSISACSADSMLQDQADEYDNRIEELETSIIQYENVSVDESRRIIELKAENARLQFALKNKQGVITTQESALDALQQQYERSGEEITRLKLAVQPPTARRTDPETSHEAAKDARFGQTMRQLNVLLTLHNTQWDGLTDFELAERTGTQQNSTGKRRLECQRAGLVEPHIIDGTKIKRLSRKGGKSMAQVWRLTWQGKSFIKKWMENNNAT